MSTTKSNYISKKNVSKIIGIQFSILSPEEIRNGSVAEITSRDTYINNKPVIGGLFDPRMGVLEPGFICPTDGLDYMQTPGYFGHINLARPVFYIQYLNTILKIIRCVCIKCGKLLLNKNKYKYLLNMKEDERWNYVFQLASKIKRCGEDTHDGCGCKQPSKIKKEGLATIVAEWEAVEGMSSEDNDKLSTKLIPEVVLKNFKRISDEDVTFMGFSPIWSRPEWMICQVLAVPPPAVRPSVKHDSQQRSEDDISHIIVNIIKANKTLQDKLQQNATYNVVEDWSTVLQYYVATLVDNNIPGVASVAQRSGRPLKSIKERLNGKTGRVRGNLMGKRVDFSARSVITPDPNLSIRELGVPLKIAKNLTKPVTVNAKNRNFLLRLVQNGTEIYPGAKILERKNGENISLRYVDRNSIRLEDGDIVHRHMLNGDAILFNRQPTLHRMSMMCHIVKVMSVGDTFRMNVADTKPYNADFDGDEMNLHMPQDDEAEMELRYLAATPFHIISPANNKTIIGVFQDSLLGAYQFTRDNIKFDARTTMNLLMAFDRVDLNRLDFKNAISNFEIISQFLPPFTLKYKTKKFEDGDDYKTSNAVLEIENGTYIRGQLEKGTLGDGTKGILHRITNDFGNMKGADFIDDLQNLVTEYMKSAGFSVGISDLVANKETNDAIATIISQKKAEVRSLIDETHLGIFENKTGKTNDIAFEVQVTNILNKATNEAGKISRTSLSKDNRFVIMVNAGSKGSDINITQMISCLGQQNVDGKRIPYGYENRTLPHFTKFDDSPSARGFIENSFIGGLTPEELFFHAMGGRVGLIDTAVKSVTWETPIILIENGTALYTKIGEWIDGKMTDDPSDVEHHRERNLELMNTKNIYIPTTDENGIVTWGEVTAVTRHDPGEKLYEIKTSGGREVIVTESKSLLIWNEETKKLTEMLTPDIKVGDCVPVTQSLSMPSTYITSGNIELNLENAFVIGKNLSKGKELNVPDQAFIAPQEFIIVLLNGYFATNAIINNQVESNIGLKRLIEGISMLCSRLGIFGKIVEVDIDTNYKLVIEDQWIKLFADQIKYIDYEYVADYNTTDYNIKKKINTYNDVVLDKIIEINIIGTEKHPKMYDLTVPSTLNFGLANGLQVRDTSQTGYIQRRLIKGLEDLKVVYDMTVRNNKNKIIQFSYGEDGFDPVFVEFQSAPFIGMTLEEIYGHYQMPKDETQNAIFTTLYTKPTLKRVKAQLLDTNDKCKTYIEFIIATRKEIVEKVFKNTDNKSVHLPVAFTHIINNIQGQQNINGKSMVDITPLEVFELVESTYANLEKLHYVCPNRLFKTIYYYYLSPKDLLMNKRFNKKAIELLLISITNQYKKSIIAPGEMVGMIAAQSIGEPTTQMTLNSVIYDTDIIVRDQAGIIKKVKIGEFTEKNMAISKKKEYYADKDTTYAELNDFYEIPSATEEGEITWNRIEAVTQHPVVNEDGTNTLIRVTTEHGRDVTATKAKSFLQLRDGKILGVDGKDLKVGDYLPVSRKPIDFTEQYSLNLKEIFPATQYLYSSEVDKAKAVMHEYHWWLKHNNTTFRVPYGRSDTLFAKINGSIRPGYKTKCQIKKDCVYPFPYTSSICVGEIPEVIELDYDFGYLIGAYCAEGCVTTTQISISNLELEYFIPIQRLCKKYNITTKIYRHENKGKEGWTSQDIRIYSVMMTRIIETFGGRLSHGKFVHDRIIFSNKECLKGFLDAYIGGDGHVDKSGYEINVYSVSKNLIWDVHQILNILGIYSQVRIPKKRTTPVVFPTYTTPLANIKQGYSLHITNKQAHKLASILNMKHETKQAALRFTLAHNHLYEYCKNDLTVPNIINGQLVMEERNGRFPEIYFDKIKSIEEIPNPTAYVYDLTVEGTRNFNIYNGLGLLDTFHFSGISTKSNVTRGVPRIEEVLSLSENPKNPSCTIYLNEHDQLSQEAAKKIMYNIEHTRFSEIVESVEICFDPDDLNTLIQNDILLLEQYKEFENLLQDCNDANLETGKEKSKWIIRIILNAEEMLDKSITMNDVHFAISNTYKDDVACIYSDYNSDTLVFRLRLNNMLQNRRRPSVNPLDQSDEIYLLKNFQDNLLENLVLRGVKHISKVIPRKIIDNIVESEGLYKKKEVWVLDTVGTNLLDILALDNIDTNKTFTNDIQEIYRVLGIEATRNSIFNELSEVIEFDSTYINYHHLSVLCDRMTCNDKPVSIFRHGINNDDIGPLAKASFEETPEMFLKAARHGELDIMRGISANVMCGQEGYFGTNCFQTMLDINKLSEMTSEAEWNETNVEDIINSEFGFDDPDDKCSIANLEIKSNVGDLVATKYQDNSYDPGF